MADLGEQKVDFEETWAIPYETVGRDEVGVTAAELAFRVKKYHSRAGAKAGLHSMNDVFSPPPLNRHLTDEHQIWNGLTRLVKVTLRDLGERKLDFEQTWATPYETVSQVEVGVMAAESAFRVKEKYGLDHPRAGAKTGLHSMNDLLSPPSLNRHPTDWHQMWNGLTRLVEVTLRDLGEWNVNFEETWTIPYETVSPDEVGVMAAESAFRLHLMNDLLSPPSLNRHPTE